MSIIQTPISVTIINETVNEVIPRYSAHDHDELTLNLINRVGGLRSAISLSTILLISGVTFAWLYWNYIRVPPHLKGLPRIPLVFALKNLLTKPPLIKRMIDEYKIVVKDALHRGLIMSEDEHPPMWANWREGKWHLVVANPADIRDLFDNPKIFEKLDNNALHLYARELFLGSNVANVRTPEWKQQRKIINPAFRRGWDTSLFKGAASKLIARFDQFSASGDTVETSKWTSCIALDALSSVIFGKNFDSLSDPNSDLLRVYKSLMKNFRDPVTNLFGGNLLRHSSKIRQFNSDVDHFNSYVNEWIDEKTRIIYARGSIVDTAQNDSRNLLEMMVSAQLQGKDSFTREDLRSNCAVFFVAGHETTAVTLCYAMYLIGRNMRVQEKVRQEVIEIMGDADDNISHDKFVFATNQQQTAMKYLTCIIKETLRLFPPLPTIISREVMMEHDLASSRLRLPKSSFVQASLWHLHHAKEYWGNDAHEFKPERWEPLKFSSEAIPMHPSAHNFTWAPFGGGQRVCIGQQFRVVLSALLLRYTWKVASKDSAVETGHLPHHSNVLITLSRRHKVPKPEH